MDSPFQMSSTKSGICSKMKTGRICPYPMYFSPASTSRAFMIFSMNTSNVFHPPTRQEKTQKNTVRSWPYVHTDMSCLNSQKKMKSSHSNTDVQ